MGTPLPSLYSLQQFFFGPNCCWDQGEGGKGMREKARGGKRGKGATLHVAVDTSYSSEAGTILLLISSCDADSRRE
jgi:hypothetical protein